MKFLTALFTFLMFGSLHAQSLDYYLPDINYNPDITTPVEFLGHEIGEFHLTHDKLYYYMKQLAEESDRITMTEYARSHEKKPLIYLTITSTANRARLDEIKREHKKLTNTELSASVDIENMPVVMLLGATVHGNEPSGANAAALVAYYMAAGNSSDIDRVLNESIVLLDPCYNPDGMHRFSTWVNGHKGKELISDNNSREFSEVWPGGRTNHYWFDLNRDWLLLTHPESQGRIKVFQEWKPEILTDHHEMGTNSTFFFQPGIPSRTNPLTPQANQDLTYDIAKYHAKALDKLGSLYYTRESFDDYYYGKGSSYPDGQGAIGILFEQGSSRGHLQDSENGKLSFPFTIRNQFATFLSTQEAGVNLRKKLLEYKRSSIAEARAMGRKGRVKGYAFGDQYDQVKVNKFIDILLAHEIEVYHPSSDMVVKGQRLSKDQAFVVPMDQDQYRLAKSIFEKRTTFNDSLFYDVSAWTMPLAMDIPYQEMRSVSLGDRVMSSVSPQGRLVNADNSNYAYLIEWNNHNAPRVLNELIEKGLIVKLVKDSFEMDNKKYIGGTLVIPSGNNQTMSKQELKSFMSDLASRNEIIIESVSTGMVEWGTNLGSRSHSNLTDPQAMILVGQGVNAYDAGEIWHYMDHYIGKAVPLVDINRFSRVNLNKYKTIIMPDGSYGALRSSKDKIKSWVNAGGNIIAIKGGLSWLKRQGIIDFKTIRPAVADTLRPLARPFSCMGEDRGAMVTGGMIAEIEIDPTHPLFYGYHRKNMAVFKRGNQFIKPLSNPYATPAKYTQKPVLSGYLHPRNEQVMKGGASVVSFNAGRGKVIGLVDNPVFRGYFRGTFKLLANAVFFGHSY